MVTCVTKNKNANSSEIIVKNVNFFFCTHFKNPRKGVVNNSILYEKNVGFFSLSRLKFFFSFLRGLSCSSCSQ